ncbi:hypothetical protein JCM10213_006670 [Rhodosporidiobolus nylandii]
MQYDIDLTQSRSTSPSSPAGQLFDHWGIPDHHSRPQPSAPSPASPSSPASTAPVSSDVSRPAPSAAPIVPGPSQPTTQPQRDERPRRGPFQRLPPELIDMILEEAVGTCATRGNHIYRQLCALLEFRDLRACALRALETGGSLDVSRVWSMRHVEEEAVSRYEAWREVRADNPTSATAVTALAAVRVPDAVRASPVHHVRKIRLAPLHSREVDALDADEKQRPKLEQDALVAENARCTTALKGTRAVAAAPTRARYFERPTRKGLDLLPEPRTYEFWTGHQYRGHLSHHLSLVLSAIAANLDHLEVDASLIATGFVPTLLVHKKHLSFLSIFSGGNDVAGDWTHVAPLTDRDTPPTEWFASGWKREILAKEFPGVVISHLSFATSVHDTTFRLFLLPLLERTRRFTIVFDRTPAGNPSFPPLTAPMPLTLPVRAVPSFAALSHLNVHFRARSAIGPYFAHAATVVAKLPLLQSLTLTGADPVKIVEAMGTRDALLSDSVQTLAIADGCFAHRERSAKATSEAGRLIRVLERALCDPVRRRDLLLTKARAFKLPCLQEIVLPASCNLEGWTAADATLFATNAKGAHIEVVVRRAVQWFETRPYPDWAMREE